MTSVIDTHAPINTCDFIGSKRMCYSRWRCNIIYHIYI